MEMDVGFALRTLQKLKLGQNNLRRSEFPMQIPGDDFWSRRRWLARLAFSFLIVAACLAYTGYRGAQNQSLSHERVVLCYVSAMLAFSLFLMGTREKHRPRDDDDSGPK